MFERKSAHWRPVRAPLPTEMHRTSASKMPRTRCPAATTTHADRACPGAGTAGVRRVSSQLPTDFCGMMGHRGSSPAYGKLNSCKMVQAR